MITFLLNYLDLKGFSDCITEPVTEVKPDVLTKCKATLSLSVSRKLYVHINNYTTAKAIWDALKNKFEEKGLSRKIGLPRGLLSLRLEDNMQIYTDSILEYVEKLTGIGFKISDDWIASIILAGLNDDYKPFIMGLEASGAAITSDMVVTKLIDSQPINEPNAALVASGHGHGNKKCNGNYKGR
jgi:hypothetical protein